MFQNVYFYEMELFYNDKTQAKQLFRYKNINIKQKLIAQKT